MILPQISKHEIGMVWKLKVGGVGRVMGGDTMLSNQPHCMESRATQGRNMLRLMRQFFGTTPLIRAGISVAKIVHSRQAAEIQDVVCSFGI